MVDFRGSTLHQKVVVTEVGESGTYGERVEREPTTGVWGQSPQRGPGAEPLVEGQGRSPLKLKGFGKTTSKSEHKFSTFTTYTVYCELAADTVIGLRRVSCNIADLRPSGVLFSKETV